MYQASINVIQSANHCRFMECQRMKPSHTNKSPSQTKTGSQKQSPSQDKATSQQASSAKPTDKPSIFQKPGR